MDLARQLDVEVADLLTVASRLGLAVTSETSVLTNADEFALRRDLVLREQPALSRPRSAARVAFATPFRRPTQQRDRRAGRVAEPSELAKVFLDREELWGGQYLSRPPRHVLVPRAEATARDWARHMFDAQEARAWVELHGGISPQLAADLRAAGLAPEQAAVRIRTARGFVHGLTLAIRVSSGELTAAEAAAELHEWMERTSRAS